MTIPGGAAPGIWQGRSWGATLFAAAVSAALLGLLIRGVAIHPPTYDELLHVLAARGIAATGEPSIADGLYPRARLFSELVHLTRGMSADETLAARVPAMVSALLLVALVSGWVVRRAGLLAGLVAGALLATSPWTINIAVFARFYTLHALAVFLAFVSAYGLVGGVQRLPRTIGLLFVCLGAFALAMHLQVTTVIALGAAVAGLLAGMASEQPQVALGFLRRHGWFLAVGGAVSLAVALFLFQRLGFLEAFTGVPRWAASSANRLNFYNAALARDMPLVWPLMPFAVLATCMVHRRLGWTLLLFALIPLAAHSLAASKSTRYVYYVMPALCAIAGVGLATGFQLLAQAIGTRLRRTGFLPAALALSLVAVSTAMSEEGYRAMRLAVGADDYRTALTYGDERDWGGASAQLRQLAAVADAVVTTNSMKALYYLGDYDFEINASIVPETDTRAEFGLDTRTGRRAISTAASLRQVLAEHPVSLIVAETEKLGIDHGFPADAVAVADERCERIDIAADASLTVWKCPRSR